MQAYRLFYLRFTAGEVFTDNTSSSRKFYKCSHFIPTRGETHFEDFFLPRLASVFEGREKNFNLPKMKNLYENARKKLDL